MGDAEAEAFTFRPYAAEDVAFVMDSWGSSVLRGSPAYKPLSPEEFHRYHRPLRERFFSRPNTAVIVCCPSDDQWLILGWIAVEKIDAGLILQYLYVKSAFKGQGIAAQLLKRALPHGPIFYTHLTDRAARIMAAKSAQFHHYRHCPHLL